MEKKKEDEKEKEKEKENDIIRFLNININLKDFKKFLKENNIKFMYKKEMKAEDLQRIFKCYLKD